MKTIFPIGIILLLGGAAAIAQDTPTPAASANETTLADQSDVAVTVYNNNRALVRDRRNITLPPGEVSLKFMDVASSIQPETVSIKSLSDPGNLSILEQNFEFDLMSPAKMMEKYVGKDVRLVNQNKELNFTEITAKLLSVNESPIFQIGNDIYLGHPGNVVLPEMPKELIAKPTLVWLLQNSGSKHEVEATYLTENLSWKADYVASLNKKEDIMNLEGWVTLNNQSGAAYQNAQLKLVAGEVNIVQPERPRRMMEKEMVMAGAAAAPAMAEETFSEYHLYTLQRRTTIKENQSKQVSLLSAQAISVKKVYEYRGDESYYVHPMPRVENEKIAVFLSFWNKEENHMGMPLPAGILRVYQEDSQGMLQFSGEDRVKHTPKDEEVRLRLGNAFDIVGERKQTDYKRIADNIHQAEFEIILRNHKDIDVTVDVVEPMHGDWDILKSSIPHEKKDAYTAIFHVPVSKDGEAKITYRVQVKY
ncbi:MAG TPA: DUF4139 domain-containing protein [Candidatus Hydrogenedentes bacterium]|nr:DUF4139 domain-containing protein [Candidatus Hydrogenedentota bacterium]